MRSLSGTLKQRVPAGKHGATHASGAGSSKVVAIGNRDRDIHHSMTDPAVETHASTQCGDRSAVRQRYGLPDELGRLPPAIS